MAKPVDAIAREFVTALGIEAELKLAKLPTDDTWRAVYQVVRRERMEEKLQGRVRRFINRNPAVSRILFVERDVPAGVAAIREGILQQIAEELIDELVGIHPVPRGIEEGETWLAPGTEMQRMLMDRVSEDAVMIVVAKRDETGALVASFAWTDSDEVIAAAQKGHRRYMELLAREQRTR